MEIAAGEPPHLLAAEAVRRQVAGLRRMASVSRDPSGVMKVAMPATAGNQLQVALSAPIRCAPPALDRLTP